MGQKPKDEFTLMDKNQDDYLSEMEIIEDLLMERNLEFEFMTRRGEASRAKKLEGEVHDIGKKVLRKLDQNGDDKVSRTEFEDLKRYAEAKNRLRNRAEL